MCSGGGAGHRSRMRHRVRGGAAVRAARDDGDPGRAGCRERRGCHGGAGGDGRRRRRRGLEGLAGVEKEFGSLDVVVNNAAVFLDWSETASTADPESSPAVLDTDLFGAWRVAKG